MSFLTKLNKYIVASLLVDWLDLNDFGRLASSVTNGSLRKIFVEIIASFSERLKSSLIPSTMHIPVSIGSLLWFEVYGFGIPSSIDLQWSVFDTLEGGVFNSVKALIRGKYQKRNREREMVSNCLRNVKSIRICSYEQSKELNMCKSIEHIEVHSLTYNSSILLPICGPLVKVLDLTGFRFDSEMYNCMVCRQCPNLTTLIFARYHAFTRSLFATLIVHCRQLSTVNVNTRDDIDDRAMQQFIFFARCNVVHLPYTNVLTLRTLFGYHGKLQQSLSMLNSQESILKEIAPVCYELKSLVIRGVYSSVYHYSSESMLQMAQRLIELHICETQFVPDYFNALPHCPHMQTLRLFDCQLTSSVLSHILSRCRGIKNLIVGSNLLDDSIGDVLKSFPLLKKTMLSSNAVSDVLLMDLAVHCRQITALEVSNCGLITDKGLCKIIENGRLLNLNASGCDLVTIESVKCLVDNCPNVKFLNLRGNMDFHKAVKFEMEHCRKCFTYLALC